MRRVVFIGLTTLLIFVGLSSAMALNERIAILGSEPTRPTPAQIELLESKLSVYLKKRQPELYKKFGTYYRQYQHESVKGNAMVRAQFLCKIEHFEAEWKTQMIGMDDGGDCYFDFLFDIKKSEIIDFSVNGRA